MEVCIKDVGSVIVHFLFEVRLEDDPFDCLARAKKYAFSDQELMVARLLG